MAVVADTVAVAVHSGQLLVSQWGFANELMVYNTTDPRKAVTTADGSRIVNYLCVNRNIYANQFSRSLISESMSVFKSLQRISTNCEPLSRSEQIKGSRRYRSVIHSCFFNLANSSDESSEILSDMFRQMEIVWHLCEIVYIDIGAAGYLLNQLLVWIKWHFTRANQWANQVMKSEMPSVEPHYWDVVMSCLLRGETENARLVLSLHTDSDREEFALLMDMIKKMPILSSKYILHEFYLRWQSWRENCEQCLSDGLFDINPKLKLIARLMVGDIDAFKSVLNLFESWYHLMVSFLLFTDPCIKEHNLTDLCRQFIDIYDNRNTNQSVNSVITAAFSLDLAQVIQESNECFDDNWWFATHFVDLLYNANQLDSHQIEYSPKFREFFVVEYSNSLLTSETLWQFGIDYLCHCLDTGLHYIENYLERIAVSTETDAQKVIQVSNRLGLNHITRSVCKVLSRKWLYKQRLGTALFWALRSEDPSLTNHIADMFLKEYNTSGQFPDEDILSNSGRFMLISDRMTFLAKYYEFQQLLKGQQLESAAQLLVSLLDSNIAPKFFIVRLLMDSLPLLETQNVILNSEQTSQLVASLEDIITFGQTLKEPDLDIERLKDKEDVLRLAIARNLARSFTFE